MSRATERVLAMHKDVESLCVARLSESFNQSTSLFDRQLRTKHWDDTLHTEALTSTAICLIGLHRAGIDISALSIEPRKAIEAMCLEARQRNYPGSVGLVIWANALWSQLEFSQLLEQCGLAKIRPVDLISPLTTMETAWLVSGLLHEYERSKNPSVSTNLTVALDELMGRIEERSNLVTHASERAPLKHRARKWVPNFADQIYSVQALALAALVRGDAAALRASDACAERLVQLQGSLGQWWWHYDPRDGTVAQGYPVYSVHQHAMAPMALMTLAAAGGRNHDGPVELSHCWIDENEFGVSMLDRATGTIWRDVAPKDGRLRRAVRLARNAVGFKLPHAPLDRSTLALNYETRPYEWAWCLYAGAIAEATPRERHPV
jgi:hypothetical protein